MLVGLLLACIGQAYMIQSGDAHTLPIALCYYFAAVVLFVFGFWNWPQEGLANLPMTVSAERIIFIMIMLLALFMRVYHIATVPSGLFIDQGYEGYAALRILHEGWHPFYVEDIFHAYALALYMLAAWFKIFGATDITLKLFYVFLSLAGFSFIYWTFRQLSGPRVALLTLFVLSVMRWHMNFSRNGFPTIQLPLYMFAALALLLYGLREAQAWTVRQSGQVGLVALAGGGAMTAHFALWPGNFSMFDALLYMAVVMGISCYLLRDGKKWVFALSAAFFAGGFYTYQAFKVFPLLLAVLAIWEIFNHFREWKAKSLNALGFLMLALAFTAPVIWDMTHHGLGTRETELSIMPKIQEAHSLTPFFDTVGRTALMFNRQGDPNARHNLQDYRMLDDISGVLLILGLAYALFRIRHRKYFYAVAGFFILSLPCVLSIDAAHANRMLGMTPFIAFLIAAPLVAFWGRVREFWGQKGEWIYLVLLIVPLGLMAAQNFDVYFNKQANNYACWSEYSITESTMGKAIGQHGLAYHSFISPRYFNYYSVDFFAYNCLSQLKPLNIPDTLIPVDCPADQGLFYTMDLDRKGILDLLQSIYPKGISSSALDPNGKPFVYFFEVPSTVWSQSKGLNAQYFRGRGATLVNDFPQGVPSGPLRAVFQGSLYIPQSGTYRLTNKGSGVLTWTIGGQRSAGPVSLIKGYYPIRLVWSATSSQDKLEPWISDQNGLVTFPLGADCLTSLQIPRGLLTRYYSSENWTGTPILEQWEPIVNYTNGNDFTVRAGSASWEGALRVTQSGPYQFLIETSNQARLVIDGREIIPMGGRSSVPVELLSGKHHIQMEEQGGLSDISLYWIKPHQVQRKVIPAEAFD